MSELRELYQEIILDHNKNPRNFGMLEKSNAHAQGHNPLCGDQIEIYANVRNGRIEELKFRALGCAISTASGSLMTECVVGKTVAEADELFESFHHLVTEGEIPEVHEEEMEGLYALAGVKDFPIRVKCATLAWHTLRAALHDSETRISTE